MCFMCVWVSCCALKPTLPEYHSFSISVKMVSSLYMDKIYITWMIEYSKIWYRSLLGQDHVIRLCISSEYAMDYVPARNYFRYHSQSTSPCRMYIYI